MVARYCIYKLFTTKNRSAMFDNPKEFTLRRFLMALHLAKAYNTEGQLASRFQVGAETYRTHAWNVADKISALVADMVVFPTVDNSSVTMSSSEDSGGSSGLGSSRDHAENADRFDDSNSNNEEFVPDDNLDDEYEEDPTISELEDATQIDDDLPKIISPRRSKGPVAIYWERDHRERPSNNDREEESTCKCCMFVIILL